MPAYRPLRGLFFAASRLNPMIKFYAGLSAASRPPFRRFAAQSRENYLTLSAASRPLFRPFGAQSHENAYPETSLIGRFAAKRTVIQNKLKLMINCDFDLLDK